jgi:outer membrane protein assembly factor BamB
MVLAFLSLTVLWTKDVGPGFAGPAYAQGKLILFHRLQDKEVVECIDAATGKRFWSAEYPTTYRDDFGFDEGPRAIPVIVGNRVYTHGAEGVLQALDFDTGKRLWSVPTMTRFGVEKNFFGAAGSPVVFEKLVILNVGGRDGAGIVAFDAATGTERWRATTDPASYSTGVVSGPNVYFLTRTGLVVLEGATGKVIHQMRWRSRSSASVNAASPILSGDEIFLSASYGTGATLLNTSQGWKALWSSDDSLSNHYATSVLKDGFLYGFHGRQEEGQAFRCVQWKTGKVMWSVDDYGAGTVTLDKDRLLLVRENGEIVAAPPNPAKFQPISMGRPLTGVVRAYPALAGDRLFLRNETRLAAVSLR